MLQYISLIPAMTSNTSPSGIASASSLYGGGSYYQPYMAFHLGLTGASIPAWVSSGVGTQWLKYEFPSETIVNKYSIICGGYLGNYPKSWTFQGTLDGVNYTTLDTQSNITTWSENIQKDFVFTNNTRYKSYRIYVTECNGTSYVAINNLQMYQSIQPKKYLLKQNSNFYTIKSTNYDYTTTHSFTPLSLSGGDNPNKVDVDSFAFEDLNLLTNSMTVGTDTFVPILKFDNTIELKLYKG